MDPTQVRVPPHSIEAEQAVLGGIMLSESAWDQVADTLTAADFYRYDHQVLYEAMASLRQQNQPLDAVTVGEWLESNGRSDDIGGAGYLIEVTNNTPSAANIAVYARIVRDKAVLRRLIDVSTKTIERAQDPAGQKSADLLEWVDQQTFALHESSQRTRGFTDGKMGSREVIERLEFLQEKEGKISGLPTGLQDLDERTSGLQDEDLIIIAARPSMGKTALALNFMDHVLNSTGKGAFMCSMEMSTVQIFTRLACTQAQIPNDQFKTATFTESEWFKIAEALKAISEFPVLVDDTPALSPLEVRAKARRAARELGGLGLIVVDYLQLMQIPGRQENRATEISEISRSLKALAKEMKVPVIAISQLNRQLEQRPNKRPVMADLRESGAIEQDADLILFIYRDEMYNPDTPDKGIAELIIGKHRNGATGTVRAAFRGPYMQFSDLTDAYPDV